MSVVKEPGSPQRAEDFMRLYAATHQRLYLYIVTLLPLASDAEDLLQEATLVLWRKFDQFQLGTNFYAWACKVTRNLALEHYARTARAARLLEPEVLETLSMEIPERDAQEESLRHHALSNCLQRLSGGDQGLLKQRYAEGVACKEIARLQNRSANAVSKSLGRIRLALLGCIERTIARQIRE